MIENEKVAQNFELRLRQQNAREKLLTLLNVGTSSGVSFSYNEISELRKRNDELKKENAALKSKIEHLYQLFENLQESVYNKNLRRPRSTFVPDDDHLEKSVLIDISLSSQSSNVETSQSSTDSFFWVEATDSKQE